MSDFSAAGRGDVLERLATTTYDVLVIGGGITGAGVALDAASRGLKVALVERADLASGTSSKSSKLVHGGLRYLEQGDLGVVRESVVERDLLLRLAPHLVHPQPFVIPDRNRKAGIMLGAGLTIYGAMGHFRSVSQTRRLSPAQVAERIPGLARYRDRGGWEYNDCRTDDARLTLTVARTARRLGADIATRCEVVELRSAGGRVVGATVRDRLGGQSFGVTARATVSATGVWADHVRELAGPNPLHLQPSKGVHLVFPAQKVHVRAAAVIPSGARDRRRIFVIPWGRQVVVGTTDEVYDGPLQAPTVELGDAEYCCTAVNDAFDLDLTPADAVGAWAGLRPLPRAGAEPGGRSDTLSRRHAVLGGPPGLVTVTGGKLTTYRKMAEDTVDAVLGELGSSAACRTRSIALGLRGSFDAAVGRVEGVCVMLGLDRDLAHGLVERHGDDAVRILERAAEHDEADLVLPDLPYVRAELRWAVDAELALTVDDVLRRRLRVALREAAAGGALAGEVADLLRPVLGWTQRQAAASVEEYRALVARERGAVPLRATSPAVQG
jgi:glycerol-3-phosphate dehydrogenase